jgi:death-on-curing protein
VSKWTWIDIRIVLAAHDEQLAEHGGAGGVRDKGGLESALARPQNLAAYGEPDAAALAAAYAFGIAKNHPFVDGNKRTALVVLESLLALNDYDLTADDMQAVLIVLGVADSTISEAELANWIRKNIARQ